MWNFPVVVSDLLKIKIEFYNTHEFGFLNSIYKHTQGFLGGNNGNMGDGKVGERKEISS